MYQCNKCLHQFSGTPSSLACCNVCENGDQFMSIQPEESQKSTILSDMRTPTCPHCGMAKLETEDIIDTWADYKNCSYTELTIGICPNCDRHFQYKQIYSLEPAGYEDIDYCDEDEIEEEEDDE